MVEQISLRVEPRTVCGKKVRFMRRAGQIPANVYGPGMESIAVQAKEKELRQVLRQAGAHRLVQLTVGSEPEPRQVLVRQVRYNHTTDAILHADFHQVPLDKKLMSRVPLMLVGNAPVVALGGLVLRVLEHVTIASLPADLPAAIKVDVSAIDSLEAVIRVRDLVPPAGVRILTDGDVLVAKGERTRVLELEEEEVAPTEAALATEAAAPAEEE